MDDSSNYKVGYLLTNGTIIPTDGLEPNMVISQSLTFNDLRIIFIDDDDEEYVEIQTQTGENIIFESKYMCECNEYTFVRFLSKKEFNDIKPCLNIIKDDLEFSRWLFSEEDYLKVVEVKEEEEEEDTDDEEMQLSERYQNIVINYDSEEEEEEEGDEMQLSKNVHELELEEELDEFEEMKSLELIFNQQEEEEDSISRKLSPPISDSPHIAKLVNRRTGKISFKDLTLIDEGDFIENKITFLTKKEYEDERVVRNVHYTTSPSAPTFFDEYGLKPPIHQKK